MKQRLVSGFLVGEIGLGSMGISHFYGPADDNESLRVLDRAIELGCNFWDTADFYGAGNTELLIGKALKNHRPKIFLATKIGNVYDRTLTSHQDQVQSNAASIIDGTPEYIHKCVDLSLKRLGVDYLNMCYLLRVDPLVPIEETIGAMSDLVKQGKVVHLGLSETSAATIRRAYAVHPITALQSEYSLWTRHVETEILPTCRGLGITFVSYSPLGRGFLTGMVQDANQLSPDDLRRRMPRFQGQNLQLNLQIIPILRRIAEQHHATPAQVALAWVLTQGKDIIPLAGTRHVEHLEENLAAAEIQLTEEDMRQFQSIQASGERYPEAGLRLVQA